MPIGTAVLAVPIIASVALLIIRSDGLRLRRNYDPPTQRTAISLHQEALHELSSRREPQIVVRNLAPLRI